jgi:hypothetical protein
VLLGVQADNERGDVDDLLSNTDVALTDEDTGVVDGLRETELVDLGLLMLLANVERKRNRDSYLETTLQEVLNTESQDVIELHVLVVKDTDTDKTANQGVTLEETLGVLLVLGQKLTGSTTIPPINNCSDKVM